MAFIRLMLAPFAGVECVAKQTGNWPDLREITRGLEPRKGELATTNRTSAAIGAQTCRLPSISALGHRQVGYLAFGSSPVGSPANCRWGADRSAVWRSGADLSAPQHIGVGGPTGRFPRKLPLGARHVGSTDTAVFKNASMVSVSPMAG